MFLYEKKIVYLSCYKEGVKQSLAGFARISGKREDLLLDIHIKNVQEMEDGNYALFLVLANREVQCGTAAAKGGSLNIVKRIVQHGNVVRVGDERFQEEEICGILIYLSGKKWISGYWKQPAVFPATENRSERDRENKKVNSTKAESRENESNKSIDLYAANKNPVITSVSGEVMKSRIEKKEAADETKREAIENVKMDISGVYTGNEVVMETASENKWEQLQRGYKKVHPFGDERLFLSIEPKDFVILRASYQRLVNNSFLLHGFYNYGHLILGPDAEMRDENNTCFYLGVPGTYFEREKMVAVMFGFEGFECSGAVEIGKFGYYMRRVEL